MSTPNSSGHKIIGTFTLAMINVAAIISLTNLPVMSVTGYTLISYFLMAAIFFFLPTAFVSAELATGWPLRGGLYSWVKLAMGPYAGFLSIWLQFIANIIWYPTIMAPMMASVAYLFAPHLASNAWFMFIGMNIIYWAMTFLNLRGMRESSWVSTVGVIVGSIIPATLIVIFAAIWLFTGHASAIHFEWKSLIPPLNHFDNLVLWVGLLTTLCGMEMSAVHVNDVKNPQRDYPRAIFLSVGIIMAVSICAAMALAILVPAHQMDLVAGMMQAYQRFCVAFGLNDWVPVFAFLLLVGTLSMASTWIGGPAKGIQVAAMDGDIPPLFKKLNKKDMPVHVMLMEGALFSTLTVVFLVMPSVSSSFWFLVALNAELYMVMYFVMFIGGIRMRYKYPHVYRSYKIPGKHNVGMWIVGILGMIGCTLAFVVTFVPPTDIQVGNPWHYVISLSLSFIATLGIPMAIFCVIEYRRNKLKKLNPESFDEPKEIVNHS